MIALALVAVLAAAPSNDAARRAEQHFAAGEYAEAIDALEEAYANEPDRAFVFAMGSAWQALGDCDKAIEQYERFLATEPPTDQAERTRERIALCRPSKPPPPVIDAPAHVEASPVVMPPPVEDRPEGQQWHRDPAGGVLLGVGLVALAGGTALEILGARRRVRADDAMDEDGFRSRLRQSNALQGAGIGLIATGGSLVVGAVIRYVLVQRRR